MILRAERCIETLGNDFYDVVRPADFPKSVLRFRNQHWAGQIGLGALDDAAWIRHFARFEPIPGSLPAPLALRYHGHQFRSYNPGIGDGRGFLFAQLRDESDRLLDLGTKGSGQTPWSRFGDGRLTLKGGVREVLATEMLEALGVNTSKTLSLIETGEALERQDEPSPTRSAVLVRLSHSHIRYGTFQRLAYLEDKENMARLVQYCLRHLFNVTEPLSLPQQVQKLLELAVPRAANLAASYMAAGFVHGVLNTDNINITGESFDYGPYRFAPTFDPAFTAAYFDSHGLYAFGRQPEALHWNVYQLANAVLLIADQNIVLPALEKFPDDFECALIRHTCDRLGILPSGHRDVDAALLHTMAEALQATGASLPQFQFDFYGGSLSASRWQTSPSAAFYHADAFKPFLERLAGHAAVPAAESRLRASYFSGESPCQLLIGDIEDIWTAIAAHDDWSLFDAKINQIRQMGRAIEQHADPLG